MASELIGPRIDPRKRQTHVRKIYIKSCVVCDYMQKHPEFRRRCMDSRYFRPDGADSLADVVRDYAGDELKLSTVYMHMQRHQPADLLRAKKRFAEARNAVGAPLPREAKLKDEIEVIESGVTAHTSHEVGLDDFIQRGRELLATGNLKITATTYLQAIKIRSEIDRSTKDRRLDMIKSFFAGGGGKEQPADG